MTRYKNVRFCAALPGLGSRAQKYTTLLATAQEVARLVGKKYKEKHNHLTGKPRLMYKCN